MLRVPRLLANLSVVLSMTCHMASDRQFYFQTAFYDCSLYFILKLKVHVFIDR